MILPTFIGIGPGRTGTSMIYEAFLAHPQICMARNTKETNYFNREYARGPEWYTAFFSDCTGAGATGEISNTYIYDPLVPARIAADLPQVKLFTILRNPFARLQSAFRYRQRSGELPPRLTLEEALDLHPDLLAQNAYGDQLARFLAVFPREQLLILFYDDLVADPAGFMARLFAYLQVDDRIQPAVIFRRVNPAVKARSPLAARLTRLAADTLRRWQLHGLLDRAKRSTAVRRLLFKESNPGVDQPDHRLNARLQTCFEPQIKQVETLTGRDLQHWYQP
jgi:hypothetical protein